MHGQALVCGTACCLFLLIFPHGNVTSWQRLAIQRAAVKVPCCARRHSVRAKRRVRATSSHGLSDATVMLNLLFPSGVGRQLGPAFAPGPSPSPAPSQSDGFSLTSRAGTRFIMPSRGCGCADLFPAGPEGGGGGCARPASCMPTVSASCCRHKATKLSRRRLSGGDRQSRRQYSKAGYIRRYVAVSN